MDTKAIMDTKAKRGRPRNQQVDVQDNQVNKNQLQICDFSELTKLLCFFSSLSKILLSIKTGPNQDDELKKEVKLVNKKQNEMLKSFGRSDSYFYFLKKSPDRLKILDGGVIKETNYCYCCQKIERPGSIDPSYENFYDILNIFVRELDKDFVPEFMEIVNTFIKGKQNNDDMEELIQNICNNIRQQEIYKLIREWSVLKQKCHTIERKYQNRELEQYRTKIYLTKSKKVQQKLMESVQSAQQEIDQEQPNILEFFITKLIEHLDRLTQI